MTDSPTSLPALAATALMFGPLALGLLAVLLPRGGALDVAAIALGLALLGLLLPLSEAVAEHGAVVVDLGGHAAPVAIPLYVDGMALTMLWLLNLLALAVHAYAAVWLRWTRHGGAAEFRPLWLILWTGLNGLFLSGDLFNIYVMLEVTTLGAVPLVMLGRGADAVSAATRYLFFAVTGSILYLLGVALVYGDAGLLYLPAMAGGLAATPATAAALVVMSVGVAMKAALFPLHAWLPVAHASAPTPASALLSAAVATAGAYLLLRLWLGPFAGTWTPAAGQVMGLVGAAGILYGSVQALRQDRIKRIIAYSTVAQLGYLLLLLPLAPAALAWNGALYHALVHGLAKAGLFLAAGNLLLAVGDDRLDSLPGAGRFAAGNVLVIAVAGAAIAGLPPTGGFLAKWWLLGAALEQGQWWWVATVAGGGLLSAAYVFRILQYALMRPAADRKSRPAAESRLPPGLLVPPAMLAAAAVALGFAGDALTPFLQAGLAGVPAAAGQWP